MKAAIVLICCLVLIPLGPAGVIGQQREERATQLPAAPPMAENPIPSSPNDAELSTAGHWEQLPLYGGWIQSLAVDPLNPQTLYAGTQGSGVYKSSNGGANWTASSTGLTNSSVYSLAIDPSNPQTLYAGTLGGGICKSNNGGMSWTVSSTGLADGSVYCLAIDPNSTQTLYVGTGNGVFKSSDGGSSWTASSSGLTNSNVPSLAIDPSNPQTLYTGTQGGGVCKSTNGGASWAAFSSGLPDSRVNCLAIDPSNPQTLYAGTDDGLFKSSNSEASWAASSSGMTGGSNVGVMCLAINLSNPQTLYAGTWGGGVCKSISSGTSWAASSNGMASSDVYSLTIDPSNPQILFAGTRGGGIFKSSNGGASWASFSNGLMSSYVFSLAIDPSNPQTLYAGTLNGGVFKSFNGGTSWIASSTGLTNSWVESLAIDPSNSQILYAGTALGGGVFKSTNGGADWVASSSGMTNSWVESLAIDINNSQTLYAATYGSGVYKSTNSGASWAASSSGMTNSWVQSLAIDPSNSQTLYAGTYGSGVYKSSNGGTGWTRSSTGMTNSNVQCLVIDPSNFQILYAGTWGIGVFKSDNGGASWASFSNGLMGSHVFSLAIDPSNSQTLYAGTEGGGVFKWIPGSASSLALTSPNSGESWGIGSSHAITWTSTNLTGNVAITLSHNGGSTYTETIAVSVPVSAGTFNWTVSGPASTTCRVKITSLADPSVSDTSDGDFSISTLPSIVFTPTGFTFSCTLGQANPPPRTLEVWNSGAGTLNWSASEGAGWLYLNPTSGSSTGEHDPVTVSVDASGLLAGTYTATITLAATGADNTPQQIPVAMTVHQPLPQIGFAPTSFTFNCTQGQGNPPSQTLEIWNAGGGTLNWTASEGVEWLSLAPTSGSSTGEHDSVTVSVDTSGLVAGTYTATITLSAPGADNSPQSVGVTLTIHPSLPHIGFSPASFTFSCTRGQANPSPQILDVWNSGEGSLNWIASEVSPWLSLVPTSGSSTGEHDPVTVSVDASSLGAGTYTATISLAATGADNSPQSVGMTLTIYEALPSIAFTPASFTFSCTRGQANPSPQNLDVWNGGGGTLNWTASEGAGWLSLVPTAGSSTGEHDPITLSVDASSLSTETYTATITLTAVGADNSPQNVGVTLVVADLSTHTVTFSLQPNWNMISLPVTPTSDKPVDVFGNLPPRWVIYAWDAANGRYIGKEQIVLGLTGGYWLKLSTAVEYPVSGQPNGEVQTEIDLGFGWNLIGVPYESAIPWGAVRVSRDGGALVSLDQAVSSDWIQNTFFRWSGNAYQGLTTGGSFQPLSGYWAKTKVTRVRLVFMKP